MPPSTLHRIYNNTRVVRLNLQVLSCWPETPQSAFCTVVQCETNKRRLHKEDEKSFPLQGAMIALGVVRVLYHVPLQTTGRAENNFWSAHVPESRLVAPREP